MNNSELFKLNKMCRVILMATAAVCGGTSVNFYLENTYQQLSATSIITVALAGLLFYLWRIIPHGMPRRYYLVHLIYAVIFSFFMVYGQRLDYGGYAGAGIMMLMGIGMTAAVYPSLIMLEQLLERAAARDIGHNDSIVKITIAVVAIMWFLGYLAAFPGIYAVDAMTWYLEFDDPSFPVSAQWSPVYAGLFYLFVSSGMKLFGSYGAGLAAFTALQTLFLLLIVRNIISYTYEKGGTRAAVFTGAFFAFVPTHIVMAVQTVQGAPFMGCFAMIIMHICRMVTDPEEYWADKKNLIAFIAWGLAACILRNNAYYAFAVFLLFIPLYKKGCRRRLLAAMMIIIAVATIYKGPVLDSFGIMKGTALREMMSMPLQQMTCVYTEYPDQITEEQRKMLEQYVDKEALATYQMYPSNSDALKANLDVDMVSRDLPGFIKLYLTMGVKAPEGYIKAAYIQNLGLCYIDKEYPDPRMWHPYLNYASYDLSYEKYIKIPRHPVLPVYDKILGKLFGYATNGYGGEVVTLFDDVPVIGVACRASTYFWILLYLAAMAIIKKKKEYFIPVGLMLSLTFTILIGPVVMYRYYAPVVFAMPVLITYIDNDLRKCINH